jgi:anthranilate synthase component 1/para-aminobenzoate synthetase
MAGDRAVILDHAKGIVWLLALAAAADAWLATSRIAAEAAETCAGYLTPAAGDGKALAFAGNLAFSSRDSEYSYKQKISAAQHEIRQGNAYEVCLTTTLSARVPLASADPWKTYLVLRRRNPVPFASYLRFGDITVASTSPERFLKIASAQPR